MGNSEPASDLEPSGQTYPSSGVVKGRANSPVPQHVKRPRIVAAIIEPIEPPVKNTFIQFDSEPPCLRRIYSDPAPSTPVGADEFEPFPEHPAPSTPVADEKAEPQTEPKRLSDEERHAKRARFVDEIMKGPAYKAYLASKAKDEAKALRVPEAPDASDQNLSKRQFEVKCSEWRNGLKNFGDLYSPR